MPPKPKTDLERWTEEARALGTVENPLRVPYDIWLREAAGAAGFVDKYWDATSSYPGLSRVKNRLPKAIAGEIRSLVHAVQEAQTKLLMIVDPAVTTHGERARFLVEELESAIDFTLDDGVDEPEDAQLLQMREFHSQNGQRSSALSQTLRDLSTLARSIQKRIVEADDEFDVRLIDEAAALAKTLGESGGTNPAPQSTEARDATLLRNQLLTLLTKRVAAVRKAADRVYRAHPNIVREVTSAYQRRQRAARRAKKGPPEEKPA